MPSWEDVLLGVVGLGSVLFLMAIFAAWSWAVARQRRWQWAESLSILRGWADENGYAILYQEREALWASPFLPSGGQVVYRIVVEDRQGRRRRGWALCGGYFLGTLSRRVAVRWDQPETVVAPSTFKDEPLWDEELDA
jgi:hypothetical protein